MDPSWELSGDDSDEAHDTDWEWILEDGGVVSSNTTPQRIIGARLATYECHLGDCVLLKADRSKDCWVAIISEFIVDEEGDKAASFVWFSDEKEIRHKTKKRTDFLPHELYISPSSDINPLASIAGAATVLAEAEFMRQYPAGKVPSTSPDSGSVFFCRRGCDLRTCNYTDEFVWDDLYRGYQDLDSLVQFVRNHTRGRRGIPLTKGDLGSQPSPATPKRRKTEAILGTDQKRSPAKRTLEFTPLARRKLSPTAGNLSPFRLARNQLHVSAVPARLPCREAEFTEVYFHLQRSILNSTSNCIYISGTPGTGKTATVREVISQLEQAVQTDELDDFIFVEINGMKITDPHQAYCLLWEALKGDRVSPTQALDLLEREFSHPNPRRVPCVVLMDELDQLVTKNQSVMYNFFNWPALAHSRLIVLAVANTMDLPERTLSNKISSRLGLTRISFPGYNHEQLMTIIRSRLEGVPGDIVEPDAIQFASRKVAAVSGDARRALDICRRAVELAEADNSSQIGTPSTNAIKSRGGVSKVTIATVKRAINEATSNPIQNCLRSLPLVPKLLLVALIMRLRRSGLGEASLGDVVSEISLITKQCHEMPIAWAQRSVERESVPDGIKSQIQGAMVSRMRVEKAAMYLSSAGMILLEDLKTDRSCKVRLAIPDDEIKLAFRDDVEIQGLQVSL